MKYPTVTMMDDMDLPAINWRDGLTASFFNSFIYLFSEPL